MSERLPAAQDAERRRLADHDPSEMVAAFDAYRRDAWERSILYWDTLRRRANDMLAHERAGKPPVLKFEYETILDARTFDPPVNYALLRITEADGLCAADCVLPEKPPLIIVDPRAGHGPGIGGFKRDSEVGIALLQGHEVYFVVFFPEPCPGQTLAHVQRALRRFVEDVARRHSGKAPVLYGNCQAGWAITLLSADCGGLVGPAVLNGSPLSYWAGEPGVNPMRVTGGLLGGAWFARFLADLGDGRFDGAWLVQNFENLKPEAIWNKYANLLTSVDNERQRFLDFERWWNGYYFLSREEIAAIVDNLFIGNKLEEGRVRVCPGCYVDLRRIRNPLIIFASYGDNITPPHQALGWLPEVYTSTDDLKRCEQRIVYLTNPHVGHLGIFVSGDVARSEHRAILKSLDEIEALEPGLYEMKIEESVNGRRRKQRRISIRFEERSLEDVRFDYPREAFERVLQVSEVNETLYRTFVGPWVRAWSTPWSAAALEWMHPMRTSRYLFSETFNPWMRVIAAMAGGIEEDRHPSSGDNRFLQMERQSLDRVSEALVSFRAARDASFELIFATFFGSSREARAPALFADAQSPERINDAAE